MASENQETKISNKSVHVFVLSHSQLGPLGLQPARFLCPWDFPGKNTRVGCHFLLQGIFPNTGTEPKSLTSLAQAGRFFTTEPAGKPK